MLSCSIIVSFLYMTFSYQIANAAQCHNYPKIIGGINEATLIYDTDANLAQDIIVMGGSTLDSSLATLTISPTGTYYPLISASKLSSSQVTWAHTDSSRANREVTKVKLSPNG